MPGTLEAITVFISRSRPGSWRSVDFPVADTEQFLIAISMPSLLP
jgi:hypothetical protein